MKNQRLLTCGWCRGACMLLSVAVGVSWVFRLWLVTNNTLYITRAAPQVTLHKPSILNIFQNDSDNKKQVKDIEFQKPTTTTVVEDIRTIREPTENSTTPAMHKKGNYEEWKKVMHERQTRVSRICRANYLTLKRFNIYNRFTINTKYHLAYCRNAKAGTTTMLAYMLELAGVNVTGLTPLQIHNKANMFTKLDAKMVGTELNRSATTLLIARHPFIRLISAYKDKILGTFKPKLKSTIINTYRKKLQQNKSSVNRKKEKEKKSNLASEMQEGRKNTTLTNINRGKQNYESSSLQEIEPDPEFPTFQEFVMYVTDKILKCLEIPSSTCMSKVNIHWQPLHERCAPCDINYKVIAKMETLDEDMKYLCQLSGLPFSPTTLHKTKGPPTLSLYKLYSSTLSPEELARVYKAYYYDFLLFDYPYKLD